MAKQIKTQAQQTLPAAAASAPKPTAAQKKAATAAKRAAEKAAWEKMTPAQRKVVRAERKARAAAKAPKMLVQRIGRAQKALAQACALVAGVTKDGDGYPEVQVLMQASDAAKDAHEQLTTLVSDGWAPPAAPKAARLGKSIEADAIVCVRDKRRADFEGILDDAEMNALTVVKIVKNVVFVRTAGGDRLMIPRGKLQLAPAA